MGVVPDLVQADQLVGEAVRRLRLGDVQAVLLLEAERVVDVWPVGRQLVVVEVQVAGHGVDRREGRVGVGLGDGGVVRVAQVGVGGAGGRRRVLAQLLPDYDEVLVLLEDLSGDVVGVLVHVLRTVGADLGPVGVVQPSVVQSYNEIRIDLREFGQNSSTSTSIFSLTDKNRRNKTKVSPKAGPMGGLLSVLSACFCMCLLR